MIKLKNYKKAVACELLMLTLAAGVLTPTLSFTSTTTNVSVHSLQSTVAGVGKEPPPGG